MRESRIQRPKCRAIVRALGWGIALAVSTVNLFAAEHSLTNAPPGEILYTDSLGRTVKASTNDVTRNLHPPAHIGLKHQLPYQNKGATLTPEARFFGCVRRCPQPLQTFWIMPWASAQLKIMCAGRFKKSDVL